MTATEFRQHVYQILAQLGQSGGTALITHRNKRFYVVPEDQPKLTDRLIRHKTLKVEPEALFASESSEWEWNEEQNLDGFS